MLKHVTIIGLGLIGGSIALGLRRQGVYVTAFDADALSLEQGLDRGVIDHAADSVSDAVLAEGVELVILCVPVLATQNVLESLKASGSQALITDVGSVKQPIIDAFIAVYGEVPANFVAGHPIAGSERHGVDSATVDLFDRHMVLLTPSLKTRKDSVEVVKAMWQSLGAKVSLMDVEHHDMILGQTSHLPHLLAYSLIDTLSSQGDSLEIFEYAAGGLRDFSRIAASDPTMWRDIFISNRQALLTILDQFSSDLAALRATIEKGDGQDLFERLSRSKAARDHFAQVLLRRSDNPEQPNNAAAKADSVSLTHPITHPEE